MDGDTFGFQVGAFSCTAFKDTTARYPLRMFLTNPPPVEDRQPLGLTDDCSEEVEASYNCLLVDTGRERVLIDAGMGHPAGQLRSLLQARGYDAADIDIVILSHLHPDHIGGAIGEDGQPAFPRATHVTFQREWDYWSSQPNLDELGVDGSIKQWILGAANAVISALQGRVRLLAGEGEIVDGITALEAFGHSPGHMAIEIGSAGERLLFLADTVIFPFNLPYPEAVGATDHQPERMVATRLGMLERAAASGSLVGASHFPFPGLGFVRRHARRWRWEPLARADRQG